MINNLLPLYDSLVGVTVDFSFKKKFSDITPIEKSIDTAKRFIEKETGDALMAGGELCIVLLTELTSFYMREPYYMAVRGSIEMRRFRPIVLERMQETIDERENRILNLMDKKGMTKHRELILTALRYFIKSYPRRITTFKGRLSRNELLTVI